MPGPEVVRGVRVVADAVTLDAIAWPSGAEVLRFAPDDALVLGAADVSGAGTTHAIVEPDTSWVQFRFDHAAFTRDVRPHIEWTVPTAAGSLAQGLVAGVPAKVLVGADSVRVLCVAAYAHELAERLGAM